MFRSALFLIALFVSGCAPSAAETIYQARQYYINGDRDRLDTLIASIQRQNPNILSCSEAGFEFHVASVIAKALEKLLRYREAGASDEQIVAIARVEIGEEILDDINLNETSCGSRRSYAHAQVMLEEIVSSFMPFDEPTAAHYQRSYELVRYNERVFECAEIKAEIDRPAEQQTGIDNRRYYSALNCHSFRDYASVPADFVHLETNSEATKSDNSQ